MDIVIFGSPVKRGDRVTLNAQKHDVWIKRTPEDMEALHERDRAAGRWHDEGGEPILYGPYKGWPHDSKGLRNPPRLTLVVTSCRAKWLGYGRRPKGLRTAWCEKLKCEVLFRSV